MKMIQNGDEVLRKGPWMPEEDEILVEYVSQFGARDWSSIRSKGLLPRTGKSCRLRWVNKLKPDLKRSGCKFSPEEEKLVVEMQSKLGNKWAKIASCLPGRTDNDVKNFWSTRQKRILRALQRPKMPSGSTDAAADTSDLSKSDHSSLTDFGGTPFQVQSPSSNALVPSGFVTPFIFEDESSCREAPGHLRLPNNAHAFHTPLEVDDVLSIKLQEMVAVDLHFPGSDFTSQVGRVLSSVDLRHMPPPPPVLAAAPALMYHQASSVPASVPLMRGALPRSVRTVKRKPRSRREVKTCFEHHLNGNERGTDSSNNLPLQLPNLSTNLPLNNIQNDAPQASPREFKVPLPTIEQSQQHQQRQHQHQQQYQHNGGNHYLDFLFQSDSASCTQANQIFGPTELAGNNFLTTNQQSWEKLPMLYPDHLEIQDSGGGKEIDTCSLDSVISGFSTDVFDSLEPLCPTAPEWWVARLF